jgi:fructose-1,6-bisphosphatase/inositol monophosphatase family enzyme
MSRSVAELLGVLHEAASAIGEVLAGLTDWGLAGTVDGQYVHDLAADQAGVAVLQAAGLSVVSEESGATGSGLLVVIDPVDGSTNASRGIPWWNTSLCAVDDDGPLAAVVVDHLHGARYSATRGGGAFREGVAVAPTGCLRVAESIVGLNGYPPVHLGWKQYRALGAAALDLCAVAAGVLDAYVDCTTAGLGPWDYLGGLLMCQEAGAAVATVDGAPLVTVAASERRVLVAAATPELLEELLVARRTFP